MNRQNVMLWILRIAWLVLPFSLGSALTTWLEPQDSVFRTGVDVAAWAVWAILLVAVLVVHPISLTVTRLGVIAATAIAIALQFDQVSVTAMMFPVLATIIAFLPGTGVIFVNGLSYPNEQRYPLRPPGALLLTLIPLSVLACVGLPIAAWL